MLIKLSCRFYTFDRNKLLFGSWVSRGGVVAGRIPSRKAAKLVYGLRKSKGCSDLASKQAASAMDSCSCFLPFCLWTNLMSSVCLCNGTPPDGPPKSVYRSNTGLFSQRPGVKNSVCILACWSVALWGWKQYLQVLISQSMSHSLLMLGSHVLCSMTME